MYTSEIRSRVLAAGYKKRGPTIVEPLCGAEGTRTRGCAAEGFYVTPRCQGSCPLGGHGGLGFGQRPTINQISQSRKELTYLSGAEGTRTRGCAAEGFYVTPRCQSSCPLGGHGGRGFGTGYYHKRKQPPQMGWLFCLRCGRDSNPRPPA